MEIKNNESNVEITQAEQDQALAEFNADLKLAKFNDGLKNGTLSEEEKTDWNTLMEFLDPDGNLPRAK